MIHSVWWYPGRLLCPFLDFVDKWETNEINEIDNSLILTNSKVNLIFFKTDSSVYKNVLKTGLVDTIVIEEE